jgi:hypothetical protein
MANRYYIAYGSNLNLPQMQGRCPGATVVGTSVIADHRLLFKGSKTGSYLTIEPWKGGKVPVAVWDVTAADERRLDRYEGFPTFYYKAQMQLDVTLAASGDVRTLEGFVYIMYADRPLGTPTNSYFITCTQGYRSFGFDPRILLDAYANSEEEILCTARQ